MYAPADVEREANPTRGSVEEESALHPWLRMVHEGHCQSGAGVDATPGSSTTSRGLTGEEELEARSSYFALVSEVDANMGRLFEHLKREGEWDNTLIIFTTDHGEMLGDHWLMGKLGFHEGSYHIPLLIRDPDAAASWGGEVLDRFSEAVDVVPTMLDWLGLQPPLQCDGRSLLPLVRAVGVDQGGAARRGALPLSARGGAAHWEVNYSGWGRFAERDVWLGQSLGLESPCSDFSDTAEWAGMGKKGPTPLTFSFARYDMRPDSMEPVLSATPDFPEANYHLREHWHPVLWPPQRADKSEEALER